MPGCRRRLARTQTRRNTSGISRVEDAARRWSAPGISGGTLREGPLDLAITLEPRALHADRAARRGDAAEAARQLRRWTWGMGAIALLLVAATWDMVFKPGL